MVRSFLLSLVAGSMGLAIVLSAGTAWAGYKMEIDDTKWISLGIGARSSFTARQDSAPNGTDWSKDFNLDNARIYIAGQVHEKVSFEFNTECVFCGNSGSGGGHEEFVVLDAIAKIAVNDYINIWGGRLLVPAERQEMNGPFYSSTYDRFKTPFYPADQSLDFGAGGAGVYGRDNGVNIWGAAGPDGALQYVFGAFSGYQNAVGAAGHNTEDSLLYAGRIAYNLLGVESNPGYYTSGTYYGGAGDILTVAFAFQVQNDATGTAAAPEDFFGMSVDVLGEFALGGGVLTLDGEYKHFDYNYNDGYYGKAFCMGTLRRSWTLQRWRAPSWRAAGMIT